MHRVGICPRRSVFSHCQLYMAVSTATAPRDRCCMVSGAARSCRVEHDPFPYSIKSARRCRSVRGRGAVEAEVDIIAVRKITAVVCVKLMRYSTIDTTVGGWRVHLRCKRKKCQRGHLYRIFAWVGLPSVVVKSICWTGLAR